MSDGSRKFYFLLQNHMALYKGADKVAGSAGAGFTPENAGTEGQFLKKTATGYAYDDVDVLPSGGIEGQVLTKTQSGADWEDASGGDEIVYLTQDEYDALTTEEKMNGTHYGIVGDGVSDVLTTAEMTSLARFIHGGGTTINLKGERINGGNGKIYEIPSDCNIIYINLAFISSSNYMHLSGSYLFTRGIDYDQFGADLFGSSATKWFSAEVDWSTFELKLRNSDSTDLIYDGHITYC